MGETNRSELLREVWRCPTCRRYRTGLLIVAALGVLTWWLA